MPDIATLQRIRRELRTCARLKHRNILPVYGWTSGFGPFIAIVSPWAENGNLMTYMERSGATLTIVRRFQLVGFSCITCSRGQADGNASSKISQMACNIVRIGIHARAMVITPLW
jgi:serine/threonine protein kinase